MILNVRVIPGAGRNYVKKENDRFKVYLTKPAQDDLANKQLIELLSEFLNIKKYRLKIVRGDKSREKIVEINT